MAVWIATSLSVFTSELVRMVKVCVVFPVCTSITFTGMLAAGLAVGVAVAVGEATGVGVPLPTVGVVVALGDVVAVAFGVPVAETVGVPLPTVAVALAVGVGATVGVTAGFERSVVLGSLLRRV